MQKYLYDGLKFLFDKFGALVFAIIILGYFGWQNRVERIENINFYRQQQIEWYKASEVQTQIVTQALEKNTRAWADNREILNQLKTIVQIALR